MKLKDFEIYSLAFNLSEKIWEMRGELLNKKCPFYLIDQITRSTDSVGANIAEAFERFYYADANRFYYFARGSLHETKHWINILRSRNYIDKEFEKIVLQEMNVLGVKLNNTINNSKQKAQLSRQ